MDLTTIRSNGGVPFTVSRPHGASFLGLLNDLEASGYNIAGNQSGGFNPRNIALILGSLVAFTLASHFVNMTLGIVCMVFVASLAGRAPSWKLNLKVAAGLVAVAFAFKELLGLNLPLI